jgi:LEA14-like dessication related protein
MKNALAAAAGLLALAGCSLLQRVAGAAFERPKLAYESWSADQLDLEGVTIGLHYRLENPNGFGLDLQRLTYKLEVEGRQVAQGELPEGVQIRAQGATPIAIPVRLRWRDVPGFVELLVSKSDVAYRVSGAAGVGSPVGTIDLPFDHQDRLALPRPPAVRIEGVTLREASLASLALELRVRVDNANAFPLPVGALTYGLRVGERDLLSGGSHPLAAVPPGGHAIVSVPVRISVRGAAESMGEVLRGTELRLRGFAGFGDVEVPFDAPGHLAR